MATDTERRDEWMSAKQVASELGLHASTVYRHVAAGDLPALRLGGSGRIRVRRSELERLDVGMRAIRLPDPMADEPPHRTVIGELPSIAVKIGGSGYDSGAED